MSLRLLIDNSLSWRVARDLREGGHDVVHVADLGMASAPDTKVYLRALAERRIMVTQDSDFGPIHSVAGGDGIGVVLVRLSDGRPKSQSAILAANLPPLEASLAAGAFVVIEDGAIRVLQGGE